MDNEFLKKYNITNLATNSVSGESHCVISLPERQLAQLAYIDMLFYNNRYGYPHRLFETILDQLNSEKDLRENNITVKDAYDHYQILLSLCGHQTKIKLQ